MDRVIDRIWIGSTRDIGQPLQALGFSGVVDLRDGVHPRADVPSFQLANRDGDPWNKSQVLDVLDFLADSLKRGRVLVACMAGMSRSACMIIGHLVRAGFDEATAYSMVRRARPKIAPIPAMLNSVMTAVRG